MAKCVKCKKTDGVVIGFSYMCKECKMKLKRFIYAK